MLCFAAASLGQSVLRDLGKENWAFRKKGDVKWLRTVRVCSHRLAAKQKYRKSFLRHQTEKQLQWIENETWEYETDFTLSSEELKNETIALQFDGLDTYAEVFLNGKSILKADNIFRTWKINVKNN